MLILGIISVLIVVSIIINVTLGLKKYEISLGRVIERPFLSNMTTLEEFQWTATLVSAFFVAGLVAAYYAPVLTTEYGKYYGLALVILVLVTFIILMRLIYFAVSDINRIRLKSNLCKTAPMRKEGRDTKKWHKHDK